ncbi:DUF4900 domain-containing protein [Deinococcus aquaticus]|uniref:DUF4900 domain-containing protein n=1 Tax=Deinococcus aquaticus TaxID=328692 RepID=UPI003F4546DE
MKKSHRTEGAMLIVTVLVVMVMMVVILAITSQLALSSRRSSTAQESSIRAMYAAEAGLSRSQTQLNLVNSLLQPNSMVIPSGPSGVTTTQMETDILSLCGLTALPVNVVNNVTNVLCGVTGSQGVLGSQPVTTLGTGNRLDFFTKYIPVTSFTSASYAVSGDGRSFWAQLFSADGITLKGGKNNAEYSSRVRLILNSVQKTATDTFVLTLSVPSVSATGTPDSSSTRNLAVGSQNRTYTLNVGRGSFAKYALLTNRHYSSSSAEAGCASTPSNCSRITFTSNTLFSGPVHTNSNFNFQGTPYFGGEVTSAGCPGGAIKTNSSGDDYCSVTANPGAYFHTTNWKAQSAMSPNDQAPVVTTGSNTSDPRFQGGVSWNKNFIPLPKNANNQALQAKSGGVFINGTASNLTLQASNITLGTTSTPVQRISYTLSGSTVNLATDADQNVYLLNTTTNVWSKATQDPITGTWIPGGAGTKFTGVIYAKDGVSNLNGPARTDANNPATAPAAIASFAQMTLASTGDIAITSDLKYADPPCSGSNSVTNGVFNAATCTNKNAKNILGIYSSGGDVDLVSPRCAVTNADGACTTAGTRLGMPKNVNIHAVLMASQGKVKVDGYDGGAADGSLGQVNLMGGIIENYYGAFGLTNGAGYGRNFVYDQRTNEGVTPPFFPTQQEWSAGLTTPIKLQQNGNQVQTAKDGT